MGILVPRRWSCQDLSIESSFSTWHNTNTYLDHTSCTRPFHKLPNTEHELPRSSLWSRSWISVYVLSIPVIQLPINILQGAWIIWTSSNLPSGLCAGSRVSSICLGDCHTMYRLIRRPMEDLEFFQHLWPRRAVYPWQHIQRAHSDWDRERCLMRLLLMRWWVI